MRQKLMGQVTVSAADPCDPPGHGRTLSGE